MPTCDEGNEHSSTQYIEAVTQFCPGIKYIDGLKQTLVDGQEECPDMWSISLKTWQDFNASCTALIAFNWTLVPFGDPFFRVFGEHVKPQLTSLSLTANMRWSYERYRRHYPGSATREDEWDTHPDYGHESNRRAKFYREIVTFLKLLAETSEEELGVALNPVLILTNPYNSKVRQDWCEEYMRDELLPLLRTVAENHPSLTIQVPIAGRSGHTFSRISRLCLGWGRAKSSVNFADESEAMIAD
ncbi:uncharacterized protein PITG_14785 [Phytophthora infestans T30-4]|uniref:Uncharacterized protein n=1 Tax=Phytophthora infestans (strain T30-4) TaxID=403677 RepID=D0NP17_PHYIT|nr:uncharacterized protein PITG_14785 [Phytophthora infestans T30-4]EEY62359.1 conserved hypothetical protein [Phytophthora infestans T30-4]|eukprot:XP_002898995.1 conserved hypothetical protein [Phytophthora infestans T30-4]